MLCETLLMEMLIFLSSQGIFTLADIHLKIILSTVEDVDSALTHAKE